MSRPVRRPRTQRSRQIRTLADVVGSIDSAATSLAAGDDSDWEALVGCIAPVLLADRDRLIAAVRYAWDLDRAAVLLAVQEYEDRTAAAGALERADQDGGAS